MRAFRLKEEIPDENPHSSPKGEDVEAKERGSQSPSKSIASERECSKKRKAQKNRKKTAPCSGKRDQAGKRHEKDSFLPFKDEGRLPGKKMKEKEASASSRYKKRKKAKEKKSKR